MNNTILIAALAALSCGCLAKRLQIPAEDHYVQTRVIAEKCRTQGYDDSPCSGQLQEDLDAMVKGAQAIDAVAKGKKPESEVSDG